MQKYRNSLILITLTILLTMTVIGSIWDFEIAKAVFIGESPSKNLFGIIFSYIGIIPTFVGWSFIGASILYLSKTQIASIKKRRWLMAFAILLFVLSVFYYCNTLFLSNANAFKVHFAVAYSIGISIIGVTAYLGYVFAKRINSAELLNKLLFLATVSLLTLLIISVTKELMCRPRFRFVLATNNEDYFRNWWQSGRLIKASLDTATVTDEFSSLPSGHSAYSMFAIFLFPTLADFSTKLKKYNIFFFILGLAWWVTTALSRVTIGAHYLTDVTIAGLVTIFAYVAVSLTKKFYLNKHKK